MPIPHVSEQTLTTPPAPCVCRAGASPWMARRAFMLLGAGGVLAAPALAQVDVGKSSVMAKLVPAGTLEKSAAQQYRQMLAMAQDAAAPEQARAAAARDLHAAFAPEALIQSEGAGNAAPPQVSAPSAAPAIDPNAGPLSKAASLAGDLGLAPQPAAPTAQEQRATLEATISRLPEAEQREARMNLADLDNQSLPAGVRAMRDARLQELVGGAPAAPVELTPQDMERGRVVQNFDARMPDLPTVEDYAPLIEQAIAPEHRAEYQELLATATNMNRSGAERDAAAEVLHATFSPDQLQRARSVRLTPAWNCRAQTPHVSATRSISPLRPPPGRARTPWPSGSTSWHWTPTSTPASRCS